MSKWTSLDLVRLKALYDSKASLAEMSRVLQRTPSSINKALARSGVRCALKDRPELQKRRLVDQKKWVSVDVVKAYLKQHVNATDANPIRLLILANKLRAEKRLPPFCIPGITW